MKLGAVKQRGPTLRRSRISIFLIMGLYVGKERSTATLEMTLRSVKLDPMPLFLRAMQIPVKSFSRRRFSSTELQGLTPVFFQLNFSLT